MNNKVAKVSGTELSMVALKKSFFGWQCRIRQQSFRQGDGRPTEGMVPDIFLEDGQNVTQAVMVLNKVDQEKFTRDFQSVVRKTYDPLERWESAVKTFEATYFDDPSSFSEQMTALFAPDSQVCQRLDNAGRCILSFQQYQQTYQFVCDVSLLDNDDAAYQLTYWHNSLFNPSIPAGSIVLGFTPIWSTAKADPDVV